MNTNKWNMRVLLVSSGVKIFCTLKKDVLVTEKTNSTEFNSTRKSNKKHYADAFLFLLNKKFPFHQMYNNNGKLLSHYIHLLNVSRFFFVCCFSLYFCVIKPYYNIHFSYNNEPPGVRPPYRVELLNELFFFFLFPFELNWIHFGKAFSIAKYHNI